MQSEIGIVLRFSQTTCHNLFYQLQSKLRDGEGLPVQYESITPKMVMASSTERPWPRAVGFISSECQTANILLVFRLDVSGTTYE
jgi:hypothetical protein